MAGQKMILCIDLDGTLIDAEEKVHPMDIRMLQNLPGNVQPILTTGRILHSAKGVLQHNGLFRQAIFPLPGVFMNGGVAFQPNEILTIHHTFSPQIRTELIELTRAFQDMAFVFFALSQVYLVNPTPFSLHVSNLHYLDAQISTGQELPQEIVKLMILEDHSEKLAALQKAAETIEGEKAYTLPTAFEINPLGINKANTLKALLKQLDWDDWPVITIGDAENDLALFELADVSFAPSSAQPPVRKKANFVISRDKTGLIKPILEQLKQIL
jgi:5-amino-6-(5-phospho-D-ribitylamino)uracil phosphatase